MPAPDFNLLVTLDVLLAEGNVTRAARKLALSPSAMSRALARLRETTGDPLLVRAGRGLVPTPRAIEIRAHVKRLVEDGAAVLRPATALDLARLDRTFTIRAREGFAENFGPALIARAAGDAPLVRLHFMEKPEKESAALRDGSVDLEIGVGGKRTGPEIRAHPLFRDRWVVAVRSDHVLMRSKMTAARYTAGRHIGISRQGHERGPIDAALRDMGLERNVATVAGSFSTALALARASDLIATVPEQHTSALRDGMQTRELPLLLPELVLSLMWHPRLEADPAHRWLRACIIELCSA